MPRLVSAKFFEKPTIEVAPGLIGKILEAGGVSGRIVEAEAYTTDPASHAFRRTERSALMFDTWGHVYVYIIYGMYPCLNFTTEKQGVGAVLIRAVEPVEGIDRMRQRRGVHDMHSLCDGPGKLCRAFGITLAHNGTVIGERHQALPRCGGHDPDQRPRRYHQSSRFALAFLRGRQPLRQQTVICICLCKCRTAVRFAFYSCALFFQSFHSVQSQIIALQPLGTVAAHVSLAALREKLLAEGVVGRRSSRSLRSRR